MTEPEQNLLFVTCQHPVKHPPGAPRAPPALAPELPKSNSAPRNAGKDFPPTHDQLRPALRKDRVLSADFLWVFLLLVHIIVCFLLLNTTAPCIDTVWRIYSS